MDLIHDLLLAVHFFGLFMGGASGLGLPILGKAMAAAPVEHRATLGAIAPRLKAMGKMGLALLVLTGVILAFLGGVWTSGPVWFWIKLLAVAALIFGIVNADKAGIKAASGDATAAARAAMFGKFNIAALGVIVTTAALAFH